MIIFKTIKFKNFGSFGNNFTQITLDKNKTTLICGNNGSGKSFAFLDSITYALFGKPFRKINISQLVNSVNDKNCLVEIVFSKGPDTYTVKRGISPKIFEIYKNDVLVNQNSNSLDYQSVLEDSILKMNYKTFTQVVILGSSSFVPFMQLSTNDRRSVIENILDIDIFTSMNIILKGKLLQLKETTRSIVNTLEISKNKIESQENYVNNITSKSNKHTQEIDDTVLKLQKSITDLEDEQTALNEEIKSLTKITDSKNTIKTKIDKLKELETRINSNIKVLSTGIDFYSSNNDCPMCSQPISEELKNTEINKQKDKKLKLESGLVELVTEQENTKEIYKTILTNIDRSIALQLLLGKKEANLESTITQLKDLNTKKIQKIEQDKDIEAEYNKLVSFKNELELIIKEKASINESIIYNESISELLKDSGVKSKIIKYYLPHINSYINNFLRSMDFFVQFNLDENFNEEIKSRNRDVFSYENFSEGEKMRIDLSLLLAWREIARAKNSINCNLLILDEVFDSSLDAIGMEELMKLINSVSNGSNIYIISHKSDQLVDKFQHLVTFEKSHNFSKMIQI
jgi:DNA repair exonuclease SbcCD ATPase subunit